MERTLVIIKPDGIERGLIGEIISRYERKGFRLIKCNMIKATLDTLNKHYEHLIGKSFYNDLVTYMMRDYILVMIIEGNNVVETIRKINGSTNPIEAKMGTIRGDFANSITENIVHSSDSRESAEKEISIWFS